VSRECLDHNLVLSENHVRRVIREFFNQARPHQGIGQQIYTPSKDVDPPEHTRRLVVGIPILNGLHYDYQRVA
jgi:hypothetical protein